MISFRERGSLLNENFRGRLSRVRRQEENLREIFPGIERPVWWGLL
jgi:hypothetical protein